MKPLILNYPRDRRDDLNVALKHLLPIHFSTRLGGGKHSGGHRTDFDLHKKGIKEVGELITWINSILPQVAAYYARLKKEEECGFNAKGFKNRINYLRSIMRNGNKLDEKPVVFYLTLLHER